MYNKFGKSKLQLIQNKKNTLPPKVITETVEVAEIKLKKKDQTTLLIELNLNGAGYIPTTV